MLHDMFIVDLNHDNDYKIINIILLVRLANKLTLTLNFSSDI